MSGGEAFGAQFIFQVLVPLALKENKKITWIDQYAEIGLDAMTYTLEDL
jgi:hypothetical protein